MYKSIFETDKIISNHELRDHCKFQYHAEKRLKSQNLQLAQMSILRPFLVISMPTTYINNFHKTEFNPAGHFEVLDRSKP